MVLFILRKFMFQTRICSHPVGLDVWFLVGPFVGFHTPCVRTAKVLTRRRGCTGSPVPLLVAYVISTIISWAGSYTLYNPANLLSLSRHLRLYYMQIYNELHEVRRLNAEIMITINITNLLYCVSLFQNLFISEENEENVLHLPLVWSIFKMYDNYSESTFSANFVNVVHCVTCTIRRALSSIFKSLESEVKIILSILSTTLKWMLNE